jgi:hypothetical protein
MNTQATSPAAAVRTVATKMAASWLASAGGWLGCRSPPGPAHDRRRGRGLARPPLPREDTR